VEIAGATRAARLAPHIALGETCVGGLPIYLRHIERRANESK
jgi:hypothetical protein